MPDFYRERNPIRVETYGSHAESLIQGTALSAQLQKQKERNDG